MPFNIYESLSFFFGLLTLKCPLVFFCSKCNVLQRALTSASVFFLLFSVVLFSLSNDCQGTSRLPKSPVNRNKKNDCVLPGAVNEMLYFYSLYSEDLLN